MPLTVTPGGSDDRTKWRTRRALRELRRQFPDSGYVFATERAGPFTPDAVNRLIKRIGERAGFPFKVHAHMLRHGCGYALANAAHDTRAIQDWLGHRSIQHTVRYTELSPTRFKDFWRDWRRVFWPNSASRMLRGLWANKKPSRIKYDLKQPNSHRRSE
jgi:integrase